MGLGVQAHPVKKRIAAISPIDLVIFIPASLLRRGAGRDLAGGRR